MFIVLEGIDGCGKTTQAGKLCEWLKNKPDGGSVLFTFEPGGWDGGAPLRQLVLSGALRNKWSEFFVFMADRCEHARRVIEPALERGGFVVCDRYSPSTLAYQILSDAEISAEAAEYIIRLSDYAGLPSPDLVLFLDISPEDARRRLASRGKSDSFDKRGADYFARVRAGYERLARMSRGWVTIDASRDEETVFGDVARSVEKLFPAGGNAA
jgi:dTMP kinase